jgi:hypothetical protein
MANYTTDLWNITISNPYTITLNDSMDVQNGDQCLQILAQNCSDSLTQSYVWQVVFINGTCISYQIGGSGEKSYAQGYLNCSGGIVQVTTTKTTLTISGSTSFTMSVAFQNLGQIQTSNGDGDFNGGQLDMDLTS